MYSVPVAYFLWLISGCGALGFHRFYLGKVGTGLLWMCSGGLAMVGSVFDFFTLPRQVREANIRSRFRDALEYDEFRRMRSGSAALRGDVQDYDAEGSGRFALPKKDSPERVILKVAKKNGGMVTASEVALEGDLPMEEAKKFLDQLSSKGFAEMRVTKTGIIVYVFPEFSDAAKKPEFEDI